MRRHTEIYHVKKTNTERFRKSAIPYMQNLFNQEMKKKKTILNHIKKHHIGDISVPVNSKLYGIVSY